ncbi:glutathione S-transferase [Schizothecium vesticola]|uniref:Glutathione S-transferase n=1 Tax=Schizothecium vesticola TaxID=314040 RepID=A0AA40EW83_9PEZI|nr:glutathione S-transferase [Schizothecium vesticola]
MAAQKITDWVSPSSTSGEFKRQQSTFRDFITADPSSPFPAEANRYHLYVSYACPWATRTLIARHLKGLTPLISVSAVHWHLGSLGWPFPSASDPASDPALAAPPAPGHEDFKHLREVYFSVNPEYTGRFTVPVLWDKVTKRIVSNESSEIVRMFNTAFDGLIEEEFRGPKVDLYPEGLRESIEETNAWQYDLINNGVYKSGFATTQEAYEKNVVALFEALDRAEEHLKTAPGPYWFGEKLTEVDVRLWVTIIRFDPVYVQHFKCNIRDIRSGYPALHKWMRNLYWNVPAFKEATNFLHIKNHYTKSHTQINPLSITPVGPLPDIMPL